MDKEIINNTTFMRQSLKNQAAIMGVLVELYTPKVGERGISMERTKERAHLNAVLSINYNATKKMLNMLGEKEVTWL